MYDLKLKGREPIEYNNIYGNFGHRVEPSSIGVVPPSLWPLETGKIETVDIVNHTCRVYSDSGMDLPRVSWVSPWFSFSNGGGFYAMPEAQSRVLLGKAATGEWYIVGFIPMMNKEDGYKTVNGRKPIQEGDIVLNTAYGNFIEIRKYAGSIAIFNNELSYINLEAADNKIFIRSQRLLIINDAGTVSMTSDSEGRTQTMAYLKRVVDDDANFVKIDIGYLGAKAKNYDLPGAPDVILHINVCDKACLSVDVAGNIKVTGETLQFDIRKDIHRITGANIYDIAAGTIKHLQGTAGGGECPLKLDAKTYEDVKKITAPTPPTFVPEADGQVNNYGSGSPATGTRIATPPAKANNIAPAPPPPAPRPPYEPPAPGAVPGDGEVFHCTGYFPPPPGGYRNKAEADMEGGKPEWWGLDCRGRPLRTLEDYNPDDPNSYVSCAVDKRVIPIGTYFTMDAYPGKRFLACDVGSAIKGKHIDICCQDKDSSYAHTGKNVIRRLT